MLRTICSFLFLFLVSFHNELIAQNLEETFCDGILVLPQPIFNDYHGRARPGFSYFNGQPYSVDEFVDDYNKSKKLKKDNKFIFLSKYTVDDWGRYYNYFYLIPKNLIGKINYTIATNGKVLCQEENYKYEEAKSSNDISVLKDFILKFPNSSKKKEIEDKIVRLEAEKAKEVEEIRNNNNLKIEKEKYSKTYSSRYSISRDLFEISKQHFLLDFIPCTDNQNENDYPYDLYCSYKFISSFSLNDAQEKNERADFMKLSVRRKIINDRRESDKKLHISDDHYNSEDYELNIIKSEQKAILSFLKKYYGAKSYQFFKNRVWNTFEPEVIR